MPCDPVSEDEPVLFGLRVLTTDSIPPTEIRLIHAGKEIARFVNVGASSPTDPEIEGIRAWHDFGDVPATRPTAMHAAVGKLLLAYDRVSKERDEWKYKAGDADACGAGIILQLERQLETVTAARDALRVAPDDDSLTLSVLPVAATAMECSVLENYRAKLREAAR
jgi:hypothetical protein